MSKLPGWASALLKIVLLVLLVFTLLIALILAQPYDDSDLRTLLTAPDGCPMPCFMDIRPGVTTVEDATVLLEGHKWVDVVDANFYTDGSATISWNWNGQQPAFIDQTQDAYLGVSPSRIVTAMNIFTRFVFGDFLLWQPPNQGGLYCGATAGFRSEIHGIFADYDDQVEITAVIPSTDQPASYCPVMGGFCSLSVQDFYARPVLLRFGESYTPRIDFDILAKGLGCDYYESVNH